MALFDSNAIVAAKVVCSPTPICVSLFNSLAKAASAANAPFELMTYGGAKHAFTQPAAGAGGCV